MRLSAVRGLPVALLLLGCAAAAHATAYHQDFGGTTATGWAPAAGTWTVGNGYYKNDSAKAPAKTLYGNQTWKTNYNVRLQVWADYPAPANQVGVLFDYQSGSEYYELLFNVVGDVKITHYTGGQAILVVNLTGVITGLPADSWIPLELSFQSSASSADSSLLNVSIGGQSPSSLRGLVIDTAIPGKFGLSTRSNLGRFDQIRITNMLFRTSFYGATLEPPRPKAGESSCRTTCYQDITGGTGYADQDWPIRINDYEGMFQLLADTAVEPNTVNNYVLNQLQTVAGHANGASTVALYQKLVARGGSATQDPYILRVPGNETAAGIPDYDVYFRYWLKLPPDDIKGYLPDGWRTVFQWKTNQNYRMNLNIETQNTAGAQNHTPHWRLLGDNKGGGADKPRVIYWSQQANTTPIKLDTWFKVELFWHRAPGVLQVWAAIDGVPLFNHSGEWDGTGNGPYEGPHEPINRIMLPTLYSGTAPTGANTDIQGAYQWIDDLEIWDGIPMSATEDPDRPDF